LDFFFALDQPENFFQLQVQALNSPMDLWIKNNSKKAHLVLTKIVSSYLDRNRADEAVNAIYGFIAVSD